MLDQLFELARCALAPVLALVLTGVACLVAHCLDSGKNKP